MLYAIGQGDDIRILPADATGKGDQERQMRRDQGGSYRITWARADEINAELSTFLA
jgi:hypothetical protein